jgi:Rib/alpha/Esp surface antigen-like repeat protein
VVDAETDRVSYAWQAGDTDTPGDYMAEWEVTYEDGKKKTFPVAGPLPLEIIGDLG